MLTDLFARRFDVGQALAEPLCLYLQLRRFGTECFLLYRAGKVAVQEPLLHLLEFGEPLASLAIPLFMRRTIRSPVMPYPQWAQVDIPPAR